MAGLSQLSCRQAWQCGPGVGLPPTDSAAAFFRSWPGLLLPHCNSLAHRRRGQCTHAATWQGAANRLCESVACDCGRTRGGKHSVEGEEGRTLAMFILSSVEDDVRVKPEDLSKHPLDAVTDVLERQYLDKVLPGLGLAVTLYDVQSIEGGFIYPNDGAAYFKVRFRLVVFRPFVGEVLVGQLKSCSREGLRVSLGFFDDILVPDYMLQDPSFFEEAERLWVWKFDGNNMYMDLGETVRFKVHALRFNTPPTPQEQANATGDDRLIGSAAKPFSPFEVVGEINGDGLGLVSWWAAPPDEE